MNEILYVIIIVLIAVIAHCLINFSNKKKIYRTPVHNILHQARLITMLWVGLLPVLCYWIITKRPFYFTLTERSSCFIHYLLGVVAFWFMFFVYISVYYIIDRSVSSRIMISIENATDKRMTFGQIKKIYGVEQKYLHELQGMQEGGFIREEDGKYFNTLKGKIFAYYASFFKKVYRVGLGGY